MTSGADHDAADGWDGGSPGTLALVIGVSRYPHLSGRPGRITDTFGLSELNVSALTAYRFATWMRESYRLSGSPLVRCWLLASPTGEELQAEPGLAGVVEPTFRNCEDAIWEWYSTARELPADHARGSRLVFFFSGHGLERMQDEQLLLPSDYLERGLVNRAINVRDLRQGLAACGVPQQVFLIDACRNDHQRLRDLGMGLSGTQVLNPVDSSRAHPDLDSPVLYGASSGQQAFGPRSVQDGLTLFGQALLSGLTAPPAGSLERDSDRCVMPMHQLQRYMNARIAQLLVTYGSSARQNVIMGGQSAGGLVMSELACDAVTADDVPSVHDSERQGRTARVEFADPTSGRLIGANRGEDPFGDAVMARLWSGRRLSRLEDPDGGTPELTLVRVDRRGTSLYDIVIRIDSDPGANVLTLDGGAGGGGPTVDCHLPWVGHAALYALHLSRDDDGAVAHVETDLDPENRGLLGLTAQAWRAYREQSAIAAARLLPDGVLSPVVGGEAPSPLPVVVASLLRLSAGRPLERAWLEDVGDLYPRWPDPEVLRVELLRREGGPSADIAGPLAGFNDLGLPRTAEVMTLAWRLLSSRPDAGDPAGPDRSGLRERLARVMPWVQPGSLFPVILTSTDPAFRRR